MSSKAPVLQPINGQPELSDVVDAVVVNLGNSRASRAGHGPKRNPLSTRSHRMWKTLTKNQFLRSPRPSSQNGYPNCQHNYHHSSKSGHFSAIRQFGRGEYCACIPKLRFGRGASDPCYPSRRVCTGEQSIGGDSSSRIAQVFSMVYQAIASKCLWFEDTKVF